MASEYLLVAFAFPDCWDCRKNTILSNRLLRWQSLSGIGMIVDFDEQTALLHCGVDHPRFSVFCSILNAVDIRFRFRSINFREMISISRESGVGEVNCA